MGRHLIVDGQPFGLSARRFRAEAAEAAAAGLPLNAAWLAPGEEMAAGAQDEDEFPLPPALQAGPCQPPAMLGELLHQAALGHLVNHPPPDTPPNCSFDICPVPSSLPAHLLRFVPSLRHNATRDPGVRWVPLITTLAPLAPGDEALCDYGASPLSLGFQP